MLPTAPTLVPNSSFTQTSPQAASSSQLSPGVSGNPLPHQANTRISTSRSVSITLGNLNTLNSNPAIIPIAQNTENRCIYFITSSESLLEPQNLYRSEIGSVGTCNDTLFHEMRRLIYFKNKGWLGAWFGLNIFSHCEFYKVSSTTPPYLNFSLFYQSIVDIIVIVCNVLTWPLCRA